MLSQSFIDLDEVEVSEEPFHHFSKTNLFPEDHGNRALEWLETELEWEYTETDFYTQYEFSIKNIQIPEHVSFINSDFTVHYIKQKFSTIFHAPNLVLVDITIHKLLDGHKMGVHNDFIGGEESHRLVVQLNAGWREENGGYLMLFNSRNPQDVSKLVRPVHNTAIGFAISPRSFHAVSRVNDFTRYTIVYTFKDLDNVVD